MKRLFAATLLLIAAGVWAPRLLAEHVQEFGLPHPNEIRIEGYVGTAPPGTVPEVRWIVNVAGTEYPLTVTRLQVLVGDVSYSQIIQQAQPYRVAFILRADTPTLRQFTAVAPGEPIAITAYQRTGSRDLLVARIEPVNAPTPSP